MFAFILTHLLLEFVFAFIYANCIPSKLLCVCSPAEESGRGISQSESTPSRVHFCPLSASRLACWTGISSAHCARKTNGIRGQTNRVEINQTLLCSRSRRSPGVSGSKSGRRVTSTLGGGGGARRGRQLFLIRAPADRKNKNTHTELIFRLVYLQFGLKRAVCGWQFSKWFRPLSCHQTQVELKIQFHHKYEQRWASPKNGSTLVLSFHK